jgi:hypothetical protein
MAKQYFASGSAVKHLHEAGFLDGRGTSCAHTVWLDDEEFALMAKVWNPLLLEISPCLSALPAPKRGCWSGGGPAWASSRPHRPSPLSKARLTPEILQNPLPPLDGRHMRPQPALQRSAGLRRDARPEDAAGGSQRGHGHRRLVLV